MNTDAFKAAEKSGYAKGYAAGRRRKARDVRDQREADRREAFRLRAFLAALPACINAHGWQTGDKKPITNLTQRTRLAWSFADEAMKGFR